MSIQVALIDSGVHGAVGHFADTPEVRYRRERITAGWRPDFSSEQVLLVPNGANHVALHEQRHAIAEFLQRGGALLCFCGFFTPWIPGSRWVHDNTHPLKDLRYERGADPLNLLDGVDVGRLCTSQYGIRGWWACGQIVTDHDDSAIVRDNFGRILMVADTRSTPGLIVATASGPLGDPHPGFPADGATTRLYRNILAAARRHLEARHEAHR